MQYENEIDLLPVKILKIVLQRNCIDYRGCVEKEELRERVKRLWKAREKVKAVEDKIAGDLGKHVIILNTRHHLYTTLVARKVPHSNIMYSC